MQAKHTIDMNEKNVGSYYHKDKSLIITLNMRIPNISTYLRDLSIYLFTFIQDSKWKILNS